VLFFGYGLAGIEVASLSSVTATTVLLGTLASCLTCAAVLGRRRRARRVVTYEPMSDSLATLGLSAALD